MLTDQKMFHADILRLDEEMQPKLWRDPRTDLYSLAINFPVFYAAVRNFLFLMQSFRCTKQSRKK